MEFDQFWGDCYHEDLFESINLDGYNHKQIKRGERFCSILEKRRIKRAEEHRRRKLRMNSDKFSIQNEIHDLCICIDLAFCDLMSVKELRKLSRQLGRIWGLQKRFNGLFTTLNSPTTSLLSECRSVLTGFDNFGWDVTNSASIQEIFLNKTVIYLSPDTHLKPIISLSVNCVYVIGGLVDESGKGSQTRSRAEDADFECYRLPIPEFMHKSENGTFNVMLPINLVVEILCKFAQSGDWAQTLGELVPRRTGYRVIT